MSDTQIVKMEVEGNMKLTGDITKTSFDGKNIKLTVEIVETPRNKELIAHIQKGIAIVGYGEDFQRDIGDGEDDPAQSEFPEGDPTEPEDGEGHKALCETCGKAFPVSEMTKDDEGIYLCSDCEEDPEDEADIPCSVCKELFTTENVLWDEKKKANFCSDCLVAAEDEDGEED